MVKYDPLVSLVYFAVLVFVFNLVTTYFITSLVIYAYNLQMSGNDTVEKDDFDEKIKVKHWSNRLYEIFGKKQ